MNVPKVQLLIEGDLQSGGVRIQGPIDDMRLIHWLLGETLRLCAKRADARDQQAGNGKPNIVIARGPMDMG